MTRSTMSINGGLLGVILVMTWMAIPLVLANGVNGIEPGTRSDPSESLIPLPDTLPIPPPPNDSEMVITPDVEPDPAAVVTPPVIDPEMAVDPTTRQPMTQEKLERVTPEGLDNKTPDQSKPQE